MLVLWVRVVRVGLRSLVRLARLGLQGLGLLTVLVLLTHHREAVRLVRPHLMPHLRSLEQVLYGLRAPMRQPLSAAPPIDWPVGTTRVSSGFGVRRNPVTGRSHTHRGVDLPVPIGTPVVAARGGIVLKAREDALNGKYVVLVDEPGGLRFAYCHLSSLSVTEGDRVEAATTLGLSGNTGRSTGPHLHFGAWFRDRAVDPRRLARR